MFKKTTLLTFAIISTLFTPSKIIAQDNPVAKNYSYITDRRFKEVTELLGWQFVPSLEELKDISKTQLKPGEVSFGITRANLYVQGKGIKGVYSVNSITPTPFGYQLQLMHANDPTLQGHLKVVMCGNYTCNLIFKRSPKEKEVIYHLPEISKELREREQEFFTDRNEIAVKGIDSLFNYIRFRPFLAFDASNQRQYRLQEKDDVSFKFSMRVRTIEKGKRKEGEAIDSAKIKTIKEFFVEMKPFQLAEDGSVSDQAMEYKIEKMDWKEDFKASATAEDRFKITLKTKKDEEIIVYLNAKKMITFVNFDGIRYATRGQ
ncbi:MAG: hypothetical protein RL757_2877 [Bacteroidota bacterium]|jgi:hypothetical protein